MGRRSITRIQKQQNELIKEFERRRKENERRMSIAKNSTVEAPVKKPVEQPVAQHDRQPVPSLEPWRAALLYLLRYYTKSTIATACDVTPQAVAHWINNQKPSSANMEHLLAIETHHRENGCLPGDAADTNGATAWEYRPFRRARHKPGPGYLIALKTEAKIPYEHISKLCGFAPDWARKLATGERGTAPKNWDAIGFIGKFYMDNRRLPTDREMYAQPVTIAPTPARARSVPSAPPLKPMGLPPARSAPWYTYVGAGIVGFALAGALWGISTYGPLLP